jgi:hypothetical protein
MTKPAPTVIHEIRKIVARIRSAMVARSAQESQRTSRHRTNVHGVMVPVRREDDRK